MERVSTCDILSVFCWVNKIDISNLINDGGKWLRRPRTSLFLDLNLVAYHSTYQSTNYNLYNHTITADLTPKWRKENSEENSEMSKDTDNDTWIYLAGTGDEAIWNSSGRLNQWDD